MKNPEKIRSMFDEIAPYYDSTNNFISFNTHFFIKYLAVKELKISPRATVLDLCCGTGDFTKIISAIRPKARIIGIDFSKNMLKIAKQKNPKGVFMREDCTNLPFSANEFDYVTMGFGLRNIQDRKKALNEIYRVLQPGGKFLHLDFGYHNIFGKIFEILTPIIIKLCGRNSKHYEYLLKSKQEFPNPDELIREFNTCGFLYVKHKNYLFGTISAQIMQK